MTLVCFVTSAETFDVSAYISNVILGCVSGGIGEVRVLREAAGKAEFTCPLLGDNVVVNSKSSRHFYTTKKKPVESVKAWL